METFGWKRDPRRGAWLQVPCRGAELLHHPLYTKGSAFSRDEREALGLVGLLPYAVSSMEEQERRICDNIARKREPLEKYIGLAALQDRNEHLFYRVLLNHIEEFLPIVYTPTVGRACQEYSHIFRRARGLWITPEHRHHVKDVLEQRALRRRPPDRGDRQRADPGPRRPGRGRDGDPDRQAGALHGRRRHSTLADAARQPRRRNRQQGAARGRAVPRLALPAAARRRVRRRSWTSSCRRSGRRFPKALLQWEDFKKNNAFRLLDRYRGELPSFNDDIQGTAAVALAGMLTGARLTGKALRDQRVVIHGAGAAGIGIARLLRSALERAGLRGEALTAAVANLDSRGLLVDDTAIADAHKREFAWPAALAEKRGLGSERRRDLLGVVRALKPTLLIGVCAERGAFSEPIVREMARHVERPLVFPMSNPTSCSEATPADVIAWTDGRALVATGSPFDPVSWGGRTIEIGQGNNAFVFPGVGLGVLVSHARKVTDSMFLAAAEQLAAEVSDEQLAAGSLFPRVRELRRVSARIAEAVVRAARQDGVGRPIPDAEIGPAVADAMWQPAYLPLVAGARAALEPVPA